MQNICDYLANPSNWAVIYGNAAGCNSREEVEIRCSAVAIDEPERSGILLYPNPTSGVIQIEGADRGHIRVMNKFGQILIERPLTEPILNLSGLPAGIYYVQWFVEGHRTTQKILKE